MTTRIVKTTLQQKRLSVAEAELWIYIEVEGITDSSELRGRLVGPKCPGIETVQIAYPLRSMPRDSDNLVARVVIPEPNFWTAQTPFIYQGILELWDQGQRCDSADFATGFKMA